VAILPLLDRVLVRRVTSPDYTAGGIYVPESARKPKSGGTVEAVGPGAVDTSGNRLPMHVKVGDAILYRPWCFEAVPDEDDLVIVRQDDIVGIVPE
jgi:chaperonin GroES